MAPLACDLLEHLRSADLKSFQFDKSLPFTPLEQLVCVIPPQSAKLCLPGPLSQLLLDAKSPLAHYFKEIEIKVNFCLRFNIYTI
jgi:5'-3' exonuclease